MSSALMDSVVRWLPSDPRKPHPIGSRSKWDGRETLQSLEEARGLLEKG